MIYYPTEHKCFSCQSDFKTDGVYIITCPNCGCKKDLRMQLKDNQTVKLPKLTKLPSGHTEKE